jgi:hypothetical protein
MTVAATVASQRLTLGDGSEWAFVNGPWQDGPNGELVMPDATRATDGDAMQGYHFAFHRRASYGEARIRFEFRLFPHSDIGVILGARDASHFSVLHFPNCGQACRAQHFWAALSRMDDAGYLRIRKLDMVRRVPSTTGVWLTADVRVRGDRVSVQIGDYGRFEAQDPALGAGLIGLYRFATAEIRNVVIEGHGGPPSWRDIIRQPTNWFTPCPDTDHGLWQRPLNLIRLPNGELLLCYGVQERPYEGKLTFLAARSTDGGRTWGKPEHLPPWKADDHWVQPTLHLTPRGRLICLLQRTTRLEVCESADGGRTWSEPLLSHGGPAPVGVTNYNYVGGRQGVLNLANHDMVLFGLGGHETSAKQYPVWTWGSIHCQAYSVRSTNDGASWSDPVNMDTPGFDAEGKPYEGNLDLTEACAAELSDGKILALIRPCYSPWMWETWSHDHGATWGPCVRGPFAGYATSNMLRTKAGALLVAHRLPGLTVHCSRDEGKTWDEGTTIDSGLWAMGSMAEIEPNVVLYVYWDTRMSLMRAQFLRVTDTTLEPVRP